jgi:hypothetical protein
LAGSGWYFDSDAAAYVTGMRRETDSVVVVCVIVSQWTGKVMPDETLRNQDRCAKTDRHGRISGILGHPPELSSGGGCLLFTVSRSMLAP